MKLNKLILATGLFAVALTSCTDLDVSPNSQYTEDPSKNSGVDPMLVVEAKMADVYFHLAGMFGRRYMEAQCLASDEFTALAFDGGYYDKLRTIAQTNNVAARERLGRDKMVTDRYYIYLYCPIDAKVGIMFLEKKKGLNIHKAVDLFITEVFKTPRYAVKIERFVPQSIINEYKDEGVVDSFTFTDAITTSVIDGQGIELEEKRYGVTIKITLPEDDRPEFDVVQQMLQWLGNGAISLGNSVMHLSEFGKKKGSLQKEEKKYSFEVGDDLKIKPMIPIDDELQDEDNSILRRNEIKTMCDEVLAQIMEEVYPAN